MKKSIFLIVGTLMSLSTFAQTMVVHFKNGTKVEFPPNNVSYVDFAEKPSDPTITDGEYVDLGLSVKWSSRFLGAATQYDCGNFYSWGETTTKNSYKLDTYAYYDKSTQQYIDIGDNISGTQYDAATVSMGEGWRMPTQNEFDELQKNCKWTWSQINGVNGYLVEGKNGNSIFFPYLSEFAPGLSSSHSFWLGDGRGYYTTTGYYTLGKSSFPEEGELIRPVYSPTNSNGIQNITDYVSVARTGQGTTVTGSGTYYTVTFTIKNSSTETIHLVSLAGVDINQDLAAGKTYTTTLQGSTAYIQNYYHDLVFTYNGKSYTVKG